MNPLGFRTDSNAIPDGCLAGAPRRPQAQPRPIPVQPSSSAAGMEGTPLLAASEFFVALRWFGWPFKVCERLGEWLARCPCCGHESLRIYQRDEDREWDQTADLELLCSLGCETAKVWERVHAFYSLRAPKRPEPARKRRPVFAVSDGLDDLAAVEFIPALTGEDERFGFVRCPFHEDDDRPSLKCYDRPPGSWYCFGCSRGGRIVDFGAELYGITPRGRGYIEIRKRLAADLGLRGAA